MDNGFLVNVVEFESMARRTVHQCCKRRRGLATQPDQRGDCFGAFGIGEFGDLACPRQGRAEQAATEAVEQRQLDTRNGFGGNVLVTQRRPEAGEIARGIGKQRRFV